MQLAGHVFLSESLPPKPRPSGRRAIARDRQTERKQDVSPELSQVLLARLSEISQQLGSSTASIEALREDMRDASDNSRAFNLDISARLDNVTMRVAKLEEGLAATKGTVDDVIMPLVRKANTRREQIAGAVKVWGLIAVVLGGLSAVAWSRILSFLIWITGHGSSPS